MRYEKILFSLYILLLGVGVGIILTNGAFAAPVIFHASDYLGYEFTRFDSGLIMTQIFLKSNYVLNVIGISILAFETYKYRYTAEREKIPFLLGGINAIALFAFTLYYSPKVVEMQKMGPAMAEDADFNALHKASEIDYSFLLFGLCALLLFRIYKALK